MGIFDVIKHLNEKTNVDIDMDDYLPYVINRALSNTKDTLFIANEVNKMYGLDKDMQYNFYKYIIPKGKRYGAWHKKEKSSEDVVLIAEYFTINNNKAEQYLELLSEEQLNTIKAKMNKGGGKNDTIRSANKARRT